VVDVESLIEQWQLYARACKMHALTDENNGDSFGGQLHRTRGEVRQAAAAMLEQFRSDPMAAAKNMHKKAIELHQIHWSFVGFDQAALKYTQARTWQDCARAIDPSLPVVQPRLESE
jgi:hypothetical protein